MNQAESRIIYDYLHSHEDGVISTINQQGKPESAVVGYSETPELELIFATNISSRKAQNILRNENISFVVWSSDGLTVQYEGAATRLEAEELEGALKIHFKKIPSVKRYAKDSGQTYFIVRPTYIRHTDCNFDPWKVIELIF